MREYCCDESAVTKSVIMSGTVGTKVLVLFLIGGIKLGFGLLPIFLEKFFNIKGKGRKMEKLIGEFNTASV